MKKLLQIMLVIIPLAQATAQNDAYQKIMHETIVKLNEADTFPNIQEAVNQFDRIAARETSAWEPLYYSAYGNARMANMSTDTKQKDHYLDLALEKINRALVIAPEESELIALQGFVHMIRVTIDPVSRGAEFSQKAMTSFQKAIAIEPGNPRAHFFMGQMEMGTAKFFGSDTTPGCTRIKNSIALFDQQSSDNPLSPTWGKQWAVNAAEYCSE
jgi:tetratricopeptide (TPR) repeat protein